MAATGGSVALRIQGATTAIDAVGWGTAASTWLEGAPAAAPPAGASLERLPGGSAGSTIDTDNNARRLHRAVAARPAEQRIATGARIRLHPAADAGAHRPADALAHPDASRVRDARADGHAGRVRDIRADGHADATRPRRLPRSRSRSREAWQTAHR